MVKDFGTGLVSHGFFRTSFSKRSTATLLFLILGSYVSVSQAALTNGFQCTGDYYGTTLTSFGGTHLSASSAMCDQWLALENEDFIHVDQGACRTSLSGGVAVFEFDCSSGDYCPNSTETELLPNAFCDDDEPDKEDGPPNCSVGNPCSVSTGQKYQTETDFSAAGLSFSRTYNSSSAANLGLGHG